MFMQESLDDPQGWSSRVITMGMWTAAGDKRKATPQFPQILYIVLSNCTHIQEGLPEL